MKFYKSNAPKFAGTSFEEVVRKARALTKQIEHKTKRRAYVRSAFFKKDKIFLDYFWPHLNQKPPRERKKRLAYLPCGIELIEKSRIEPTSRVNPNRKSEVLYRFAGATPSGELFFVQIKEDTKSGNKYLMSVFPPE